MASPNLVYLAGSLRPQVEQGILAPLAGVLDAPVIVALGDTLILQSFDDVEAPAYAAALGFTGTLISFGTPGGTLDDMRADLDLAQADARITPTAGSNLYLLHAGIADAATLGPHTPANGTAFLADLNASTTDIAAAGDIAVPMTVAEGGPNVAGYNSAALAGFIEGVHPNWYDGGAVVDLGALTATYTSLLSGGAPVLRARRVFHEAILSRVAARALGVRSSDALDGRSVVIDLREEMGQIRQLGEINTVPVYAGDPEFAPLQALSYAAKDRAGALLPHLRIDVQGFTMSVPGGAGAAAYPRVADPRLHEPDLLTQGVVIDDASGAGTIKLGGLPPGQQFFIALAGSKAITDTDLRASIDVNGLAGVLDASAGAASNELRLGPGTISGAGEIVVSVSAEAGSTEGNVMGAVVDFVADGEPNSILPPSLTIAGGSLTYTPGAYFAETSVTPTLRRDGSEVTPWDGSPLALGQGDVGASFEVSEVVQGPSAAITVPSAPRRGILWQPSDNPNVTRHWRASEGLSGSAAISSWTDLISGSVAVQASADRQPALGAINGIEAVESAPADFDNPRFLTAPSVGASGAENRMMAVIARIDATDPTSSIPILGYGNTGAGAQFTFFRQPATNPGSVRVGLGSGFVASADNVVSDGALAILVARVNGPTFADVTLRVNGIAYQGAGTTAIATADGSFFLGKGFGTNGFDGALNDAIFGLGSFTDEDLERVEGYLAHYHEALDLLDASHPFKTSAPT